MIAPAWSANVLMLDHASIKAGHCPRRYASRIVAATGQGGISCLGVR